MNEPCYFHQMACYEAAKREWVAAHPDALPAEYEAAMRALAMGLGV